MSWLSKLGHGLQKVEYFALPLAIAAGVPGTFEVKVIADHIKGAITEAAAIPGATNTDKLVHVEASAEEGLAAMNAGLALMNPPMQIGGDKGMRRAMVEDNLAAVKAATKAEQSTAAWIASWKQIPLVAPIQPNE